MEERNGVSGESRSSILHARCPPHTHFTVGEEAAHSNERQNRNGSFSSSSSSHSHLASSNSHPVSSRSHYTSSHSRSTSSHSNFTAVHFSNTSKEPNSTSTGSRSHSADIVELHAPPNTTTNTTNITTNTIATDGISIAPSTALRGPPGPQVGALLSENDALKRQLYQLQRQQAELREQNELLHHRLAVSASLSSHSGASGSPARSASPTHSAGYETGLTGFDDTSPTYLAGPETGLTGSDDTSPTTRATSFETGSTCSGTEPTKSGNHFTSISSAPPLPPPCPPHSSHHITKAPVIVRKPPPPITAAPKILGNQKSHPSIPEPSRVNRPKFEREKNVKEREIEEEGGGRAKQGNKVNSKVVAKVQLGKFIDRVRTQSSDGASRLENTATKPRTPSGPLLPPPARLAPNSQNRPTEREEGTGGGRGSRTERERCVTEGKEESRVYKGQDVTDSSSRQESNDGGESTVREKASVRGRVHISPPPKPSRLFRGLSVDSNVEQAYNKEGIEGRTTQDPAKITSQEKKLDEREHTQVSKVGSFEMSSERVEGTKPVRYSRAHSTDSSMSGADRGRRSERESKRDEEGGKNESSKQSATSTSESDEVFTSRERSGAVLESSGPHIPRGRPAGTQNSTGSASNIPGVVSKHLAIKSDASWIRQNRSSSEDAASDQSEVFSPTPTSQNLSPLSSPSSAPPASRSAKHNPYRSHAIISTSSPTPPPSHPLSLHSPHPSQPPLPSITYQVRVHQSNRPTPINAHQPPRPPQPPISAHLANKLPKAPFKAHPKAASHPELQRGARRSSSREGKGGRKGGEGRRGGGGGGGEEEERKGGERRVSLNRSNSDESLSSSLKRAGGKVGPANTARTRVSTRACSPFTFS